VLKRLFVCHFGPGGVKILVGERHVSRSPPIFQLTWQFACTVIIGFRGCFAGHKDKLYGQDFSFGPGSVEAVICRSLRTRYVIVLVGQRHVNR
jgi:hypothetical protein